MMKTLNSARSWWATAAAVALLGLGAGVSARPVSLMVDAPGPYGLGSGVTFRLVDDDPSQMCDSLGLCAADFRISFDPSALQFTGLTPFTPTLDALGALGLAGPQEVGGALGAYVDISLVAIGAMPTSPTEVLGVSFSVVTAASGLARVVVDPVPQPSGVYTYPITQVDTNVPLATAVPEPSSLALLAGGLAAGFGLSRRRTAKR